jgi:hypothetical protein
VHATDVTCWDLPALAHTLNAGLCSTARRLVWDPRGVTSLLPLPRPNKADGTPQLPLQIRCSDEELALVQLVLSVTHERHRLAHLVSHSEGSVQRVVSLALSLAEHVSAAIEAGPPLAYTRSQWASRLRRCRL